MTVPRWFSILSLLVLMAGFVVSFLAWKRETVSGAGSYFGNPFDPKRWRQQWYQDVFRTQRGLSRYRLEHRLIGLGCGLQALHMFLRLR